MSITPDRLTFDHDLVDERVDPRCSSVREHCRELRTSRFGKCLPLESGQIQIEPTESLGIESVCLVEMTRTPDPSARWLLFLYDFSPA